MDYEQELIQMINSSPDKEEAIFKALKILGQFLKQLLEEQSLHCDDLPESDERP